MKKALSAVLALLMILSCMVFPTVAEEATKENIVLLSNCDSTAGWHGVTVDTENKTEGSGSVSRKSDGGASTAAFMFEWVEGKDLDISKMNRMVFDLYLSDVSLATLSAEIELHSVHNGEYTGGWSDTHEVHVRPADIANYFVSDPVKGWNRVEIPLSDFVEEAPGTTIFDNTKMMYLRMYLPNDGSTVGTPGTEYQMNVDNVHFSDRTSAIASVPGFDILVADGETTQNWRDHNDEGLPRLSQKTMADRGNVVAMTYTGNLYANGGWSHPSGGGTKPTNGIKTALLVPAVDASNMKYFVFDLYISDPSLLEGTTFYLELTSSSKADVEETNWDKTLADLKGSALVAGWNRFYVDLSTGNGTTDWSRWNYLRLHNHSGLDLGTKTLTLAWDNVGFAKELPPEPEMPDVPVPIQPTLISITTGDSLTNLTATTTSKTTLDKVDPWQGEASLAQSINGTSTATAAIIYEWLSEKSYDATLIQKLCFDLYVSDPAAFDLGKFELELRGVGGGDTKELALIGTLSDMKGEALVAGWNHFEIPLTNLKGTTDMTQFNWFRIFYRGDGGAIGVADTTTTVKLDNVYLTAESMVYTDKIPLSTSPSGKASAGTISPSYGSGNYMHSVTYANTTYDITAMSYIEFDVKIDNEMVNKIHFRMDITSAGKSDYNQITRTRELSRWCGGDLPLNEWVHVKVPISFLQNSTGSFKSEKAENGDNVPDMTSIPDLTKINFFRFFSNNMGDGFKAQVGEEAYTATYGCQMKNFCFTKELEGGEELVFDAETKVSGTHAAQFQGGTTADVQLNSGGTLRDIDGDGDNEWVAVEKAAAGVNAGTGAIPISFSFEDTVRNAAYANLVSLRFDLYCNSESFLNHTFDFEMTSSRGSDVGEATGKYVLNSLIIEDLGDGWYTVDIPLSKLTGRANGSKWSAPKAAFTANRFNFFRMFNHANLNYDAGLLVAVDNIRVTRAAADQIEVKFEIPAGAIPFTSNVLDFVDLNLGNNYFHGRTTRARDAKIPPNMVDATVYNLICANLYLENYEELYDELFCFEVTSAGRCDSEENSINSASLSAIFTRFDGQPLQNGNNYVYLDVYSPAFNTSACDLTQVDFIRIFNQSDVVASKNTVAKLTDLHFANDNILNTATAKNMKIEGVSLNLNDNITLNVTANIHPSLKDYTMTMTADGISVELKGVRVGATNQVIFSTPAIQETELAKEFSFSLVGKTSDGKVLSSSIDNYSVKKYCVDMLDGIENGKIRVANADELSAMLTDLLVLGAAVQKMEGATDLVTDGVDVSKASMFIPMAVYTNSIGGQQGACPAEFVGISDEICNFMEDNISFQINFKVDSVEGLKLKMAVGSGEATIYDEFIDNGDGTYGVLVSMRAFEVTSPYTCTFEGYRGYTYTISMGSLLMQARENAMQDPSLAAVVELVEAIGCYANSVYNYYASQQ